MKVIIGSPGTRVTLPLVDEPELKRIGATPKDIIRILDRRRNAQNVQNFSIKKAHFVVYTML